VYTDIQLKHHGSCECDFEIQIFGADLTDLEMYDGVYDGIVE
jgi:hypothetical protein